METASGYQPKSSSSVRTQACVPCAKRKVRCDRKEPCQNCKRRKQDRCTYPEVSPSERIRQLEDLVKKLGGDPEHPDGVGVVVVGDLRAAKPQGTNSHHHHPAQPQPQPRREEEEEAAPRAEEDGRARRRQQQQQQQGRSDQNGPGPTIVEEAGTQVYLESNAWHSWDRDSLKRTVPVQSEVERGAFRPSLLAFKGPDALQNIVCQGTSSDLQEKLPSPEQASVLWSTYRERVNPLLKLTLDWDLDPLFAATTTPSPRRELSAPEYCLLFAVYLISTLALSDEECVASFEESRHSLLSNYHLRYEQALGGSNVLCISDIQVLQSLTIYVVASFDRLNTASVWSLMGLIIRNAERMGIHRDGTFLGLNPAETERRRRLWWSLQHFDLVLGVRSGSTPLTLFAAWDTKLPLNIEDEDIKPDMTEPPEERKGSTGMSLCLCLYWVILEQRIFHREQRNTPGLALTWDDTLTEAARYALIDRLETGLNEKFLQFCDPIRPLDQMVQIVCRMFISGMRRLVLNVLAQSGQNSEVYQERRLELLNACTQYLKYEIFLHSQRSLDRFRWRTRLNFQWSALVCIIFEVGHRADTPEADSLWALLSELYSINTTLADFQEDRRRAQVAELIVAAWRVRERVLLERHEHQPTVNEKPQKPVMVAKLEVELSKLAQDQRRLRGQSERGLGKVDSEPDNGPELSNRPFFDQNTGFVEQMDLAYKLFMDHFDPAEVAEWKLDAFDWSFWDSQG